MTPPRVCIYCRAPLPSPPPREHVVPRSLTRGVRNNLTIGCVCTQCNSYFGRELDSVFVEDTLLAFLRYRAGVKQDTRRAPAPHPARVSVSYNGMRVELHPRADGTDYERHLPTQVGFHSQKTGEWRYFLLADLKHAACDPTLHTAHQHIVGEDSDFKERAIEALHVAGIEGVCGVEDHVVAGKTASLELEIGSLVDITIRRCMAKLAFNYLAWVATDRRGNADWLMQPDFDHVREFVRTGDSGAQPRMAMDANPVPLKSANAGTPVGHVAMVAWQRAGADVLAKVSLFYQFSWRVELARSYRGIWWDLRSAHIWDLIARTAERVPCARVCRVPLR